MTKQVTDRTQPPLTDGLPGGVELDASEKVYSTEEIASLKDKGLSCSQIGKIVGTSKQNISQRLKAHGVSVTAAEVFKKDRPAILRQKQEMLLKSITPKVIDKMSGRDRFIAVGIAMDKELALEGKAAGGVVSILNIAIRAEAAQAIDVTPTPEVTE